MQDKLPEKWRKFLAGTEAEKYLKTPLSMLEQRRGECTVFPPEGMVFRAFELTPPEELQAVIIGQDPYHDDGQAHGLAFSVPDGVAHPPSLRNIFKEYAADLNREIPVSGSLEKWAKSGILLLNSVLSVDAHAPGSHRSFGWEKFTDAVIAAISGKSSGKVFILWGSYAIRKAAIIDGERHTVITGVHPSPLSAYRGFFNSKPFSRAKLEWPEL
ncbi:MAG: uracil-DNA glycosylase [Lentisphaeria bacterium]|nr:uracil-DNA glycosylase [Lentisphaeria bacterium]